MISAAQGAEKKTPLNPNGGTWPSIIAWQCLSLLLKPAYPPAWQTMGTPVRWKLFLLFFPGSLFFSPSDHGSPPGAHSTVEATQLPPGNWDVLDKLCPGFVHELTLVCCCSNTVNDELPLFFPHPLPSLLSSSSSTSSLCSFSPFFFEAKRLFKWSTSSLWLLGMLSRGPCLALCAWHIMKTILRCRAKVWGNYGCDSHLQTPLLPPPPPPLPTAASAIARRHHTGNPPSPATCMLHKHTVPTITQLHEYVMAWWCCEW